MKQKTGCFIAVVSLLLLLPVSGKTWFGHSTGGQSHSYGNRATKLNSLATLRSKLVLNSFTS